MIKDYSSILECIQDTYGASVYIVDKGYVGGGDTKQLV